MRGVVLLALLTVCESCAMFECQDLNQVVCAKREKGVILLNSLGCLAGTNCSLSDLLIWDEGAEIGSRTTTWLSASTPSAVRLTKSVH